MEGVDPKELEFALEKIEDGFIFERFGSSFLSSVLGYEFIPQGGLKDKGIDGLEHCFNPKGREKSIYQLSIDKNPLSKLMSTLNKLAKNGIEYDQLVFVTNQLFKDKDTFIDEAYSKYKKPIRIFDISWFSSNINTSPATIAAYKVFIDSYLHEFQKPGKSYIVGDMIEDPRLFVFLRRQRDANDKNSGLDEILSDALIMLALEGTDSDKGIFKTEPEILESIKKYIKFDPKLLHRQVLERLKYLSGKPKKIQYHTKSGAYCLPYETRLLIKKRDVEDASLHEKFLISVESKLKSYLKDADIIVKDCAGLIEGLINKIFYDQGMEFADFILKGENQDAIEKKLPDLISATVEASSVVKQNKESVKTSLLMTIREIVYNGSEVEIDFLRRLSNTYMMLFLVQCDPKLCMYFSSLASRLNIYVCTSIIIPALSEYYLEPINKRHWNLLKGAHESGVRLIINETILHELINHFKKIINRYECDYKGNEIFYESEKGMLLIDEIMIRAFFYAKLRKKTSSFRDFLDNFIDSSKINTADVENDVLIFLKEEFGIEYRTDKSMGISIDRNEQEELFEKLKIVKHSEAKALNDSRIILAIYDLRDRRNEKEDKGIFGYKTWWLSKDVITHKTLCELFQKNIVSCYIRPDFLFNYISLAPKRPEVEEAFKSIFPSLIGVNVSFYVPKDLTEYVHQQIKEHKAKNPARLQSLIVTLTEHLATDPSYKTREKVKHYFESNI